MSYLDAFLERARVHAADAGRDRVPSVLSVSTGKESVEDGTPLLLEKCLLTKSQIPICGRGDKTSSESSSLDTLTLGTDETDETSDGGDRTASWVSPRCALCGIDGAGAGVFVEMAAGSDGELWWLCSPCWRGGQ
jgi:hypothetical protein